MEEIKVIFHIDELNKWLLLLKYEKIKLKVYKAIEIIVFSHFYGYKVKIIKGLFMISINTHICNDNIVSKLRQKCYITLDNEKIYDNLIKIK